MNEKKKKKNEEIDEIYGIIFHLRPVKNCTRIVHADEKKVHHQKWMNEKK